eukprot:761132-Hanusia_phi.AAC.1
MRRQNIASLHKIVPIPVIFNDQRLAAARPPFGPVQPTDGPTGPGVRSHRRGPYVPYISSRKRIKVPKFAFVTQN